MTLENLFVSKLVDLNEAGDSNRYEYMGLTKAIQKYGFYREQFEKFRGMQERKNAPVDPILRNPKSFEDWLATEI